MYRSMLILIALLCCVHIASAEENSSPWSSSYTLEAKGEYEKAAAVLVPLLGKGEDHEFARLRYGWLNYLQGNFNDSIKAYQQALEQNTRSFDARLGIALPLMAQKRWKEAMRYLKQVLAKSPLNYTANTRLMVCEEGLKQWQTLEKHASLFSSYYPSDATTLIYLARAYAWQGKKDLAAARYERVLVRYPEHLEATRYLH
ncbi:MAG: tetratricopeptide repeat protein [Mariprofundaceae bacterium]